MDPGYLEKLKEEQKKGLAACGQKIQQWNKFKDDYESLKSRLQTLADNVSHDVMVPFGPQAMMPGKLVHTNEVLVLLGDNWFAERSSKQASEIADRRVKHCQKMLDDLDIEKKQYDNWLRFTGEVQGDGVEILEEYDAEKEKAWRERHRQYLRARKKGNSSHISSLPVEAPKNIDTSIDEFMSKLNKLQLIEDDKNELESLDDEEEEEDNDGEEMEDSEKRVRWKDQITDKQNCITFTHHKSEDTQQTSELFQPSTSDVPLIQSPSDIYKCFEKSIQKEEPKSILKVKSNADILPKRKPLFDDLESIPIVNVPETYPLPKLDQFKLDKKKSSSSNVSLSVNTTPAFSGEIRERDSIECPQTPQVQAQSKPVSKFKTFRQEKKK